MKFRREKIEAARAMLRLKRGKKGVIAAGALAAVGLAVAAAANGGWGQRFGFSAAVDASAAANVPAVSPAAERAAAGGGGDRAAGAATVISPAVKNTNQLGMTAKAVFSAEENDGSLGTVLFAQKQNEALPVASLTKLMTALVVLEHYNLAQPVAVTPDVMAVEGDQGDLQPGQQLTVKNLLYIMLLESSNRAAKALSDVMGTEQFVAAMNQQAKALGLKHTHYADPSGLSGRSLSTARDTAALAAYLFNRYPLFGVISTTQTYAAVMADGKPHHQAKNINELLGEAPGIASGKTGFTDEALGCLMEIQRGPQGRYTVDVLLGSDDRFGDMEKLFDYVNPKS